MKIIILTCTFFILSSFVGNTPETCYCNDGKVSWTAFCGRDWTCEKCCEKTKPKPKPKNEKNE